MVSRAIYAGDVNQALAELGSTVYKTRDPDCNGCPLRQWCRAYQILEKVIVIHLASVSSVSTLHKVFEDPCPLCGPIPIPASSDAPPVTSYPMKIERKKQMEELNIVSVVEWRSGSDRSFLLTRRLEGGES